MPRQQRDHRGESFEIRNTTRATTDHDEIRRWAEQWNARPARVRGTGGRDIPGTLRLDSPDDGPDPDVEPISWTDWFRSFDRNNLAFLYEERTEGETATSIGWCIAPPSRTWCGLMPTDWRTA